MKAPPDFLPPLEREEQAVCVKLLRACGFIVRSTSQYRASHIAEGVPDLMLHHRGLRAAGWFEVKKYKARGYHPLARDNWRHEPLSEKQVIFREDALACGQLYGCGGRAECEEFVIGLWLASRAGNGGITIDLRTLHRRTP